jgi:hypothetical protein
VVVVVAVVVLLLLLLIVVVLLLLRTGEEYATCAIRTRLGRMASSATVVLEIR